MKDYKKVAILGIGTEGLALASFLAKKAEKITILDKMSEAEIADRLKDEELDQFNQILADSKIEKIFGQNYLENLNAYDVIFRSPGITVYNSKIQAAKDAGVEISSQIKLFFELCPCPIVGVTGTKGKGTTASLIYEMIKRNNQDTRNNDQTTSNDQATNSNVYLAGNIGYPAITLIPRLKANDIVILELSSFQLMDLDRNPHVVVVTNLSEDHLDYHANIEEYREAKFNILKYQNETDFAVLNKNSTFAKELLDQVVSKKKFFSGTDSQMDSIVTKIDNKDTVVLYPETRDIRICNSDEIKLFGRHNLENIAAAALAADVLGVDQENIASAAKEFSGLPHRIEFVAEINGIKYINDSYATNPDPAMAAINSFSQPKILILGGSSKGADFSVLADKVVASNTKSVILIDPEGQVIKRALEKAGFEGKIIDGFSNIDDIVKRAKEEASPGDIILLSPACASFGMFKNYKDRGEKFKDAVLKLQK